MKSAAATLREIFNMDSSLISIKAENKLRLIEEPMAKKP